GSHRCESCLWQMVVSAGLKMIVPERPVKSSAPSEPFEPLLNVCAPTVPLPTSTIRASKAHRCTRYGRHQLARITGDVCCVITGGSLSIMAFLLVRCLPVC